MADDWFAQYAPGAGGPMAGATEQGGWNGPWQRVGVTDPGQGGQVPTGGGAPGAGGDASWWNPADPKGSITALFGGQPPSSQTILAHAPQLQAAGIQISPPNAEGITSKINIPGTGWTRILDGGTAGGQGTGWTFVPQGNTGPGGSIPMGGAGGGSPYGVLGGGTTPLSDLAAGPNPLRDLLTEAATGLTSSPGYQFQLQQGQQGLERSAAARGTLLTGGTAKALDRYSQDYAQNAYNSRVNQLLGVDATRFNQLSGEQGQRAGQLSNLASLGLGAAGQQANLGAGYGSQAGNILTGQASNTGNLITGQGNANAASTIAQGNAWAQGVNAAGSGVNNALQMYYLSRLYGGGGGAGTIPTPPAGYGVLA